MINCSDYDASRTEGLPNFLQMIRDFNNRIAITYRALR